MKSLIFYIAIAGIGYFIYNSSLADRDDDGSIISGGSIDAFQIQVGDCFNDNNAITDEDEALTDVPGVPCIEAHDNEVYAVFDTKLQSYPGDDAMWDVAFESCHQRFENFVGRDYESSALDILTLYPTETSWMQNDDREIVCAVYDMELNKLTGTVRGMSL